MLMCVRHNDDEHMVVVRFWPYACPSPGATMYLSDAMKWMNIIITIIFVPVLLVLTAVSIGSLPHLRDLL